MTSKKELGQFFTTNSDKILKGFENLIKNKSVLDPFAGSGDLLQWAKKNGADKISGLDIDPKLIDENIKLNDSLKEIPQAKFILTNPPYLAKNKMSLKQKSHLDLASYEDLYLLALKKILVSSPIEGIIIIPVNFFSAENSDALRKEFLDVYEITNVNYFREQMFSDTTYNVVAFHFIKKSNPSTTQMLNITIFPDEIKASYQLDSAFNYRIAGEKLNLVNNTHSLKIKRLTEEMMNKNVGSRSIYAFLNDKNTVLNYSIKQSFQKQICNNIILINCIDTSSSKDAWIKAEDIRTFDVKCLVGKNTSRNIVYTILPKEVSIEDQEKMINMFNQQLNSWRNEFNSLFLTNFRDNDRKRISFDFCYKLLSYCYNQIKNDKVKI